jgi:hypothetical protein
MPPPEPWQANPTSVSQPIKSLFNNHRELRVLLEKTRVLADLHRQFVAVAPKNFATTTQVLSLTFGTLSIAVTNATLAAKLRQAAPELVVALQNRGCAISAIRVKVQVSFDLPQPRSIAHKLSPSARNTVTELCSQLGDSPLKHALEKLSEN